MSHHLISSDAVSIFCPAVIHNNLHRMLKPNYLSIRLYQLVSKAGATCVLVVCSSPCYASPKTDNKTVTFMNGTSPRQIPVYISMSLANKYRCNLDCLRYLQDFSCLIRVQGLQTRAPHVHKILRTRVCVCVCVCV